MKIFVYGTLLKRMSRNSVLNESQYLGPALIKNVSMYDLGSFPGIKKKDSGDNFVTGEIYEIDHDVLDILDAIESYSPNSPEHSLYIREKVNAILISTGEQLNVSAYFYNFPIQDDPIISHGDYRRYLLEKSGDI